VLAELTIQNFAVIRETHIEFGPGLNALTGETGAGKSIVLDALGAVLGERTSPTVVRGGEQRAFVEALFELAGTRQQALICEQLRELGIEHSDGEALILSRDISPGRSTARINGRAVTAAALTSIGELLVDIHGQSDHLSLLRPAAQLDMLDSYAGTLELRGDVRDRYRAWRETQRRVEAFDSEQRERVQRVDLLRFQLDEIEKIAPASGELDELERERLVLSNAERLVQLAEQSRSALEGAQTLDTLDAGALDRIRGAEAALSEMARFDSTAGRFLDQLRNALFALEELSSDLRGYLDQVMIDPERLEVVNQRIQTVRTLLRKYGQSVEEVLEYASGMQAELDELERQDMDIGQLREHERHLRRELADAAVQLSAQRMEAARGLGERVEQAIGELAMGAASFEVAIRRRDDAGGIEQDGDHFAVDETGIDRVTFMLATNRGDQPLPLARVASGGETARLMLALKSILSAADATPTLVFDEIDVGVGGRSGQVVGEKLWSLTANHQVIVISHLPQVAAFADRHTAMLKREIEGRTVTTAAALDTDASLDEIATMFDGKPVTPESRANAEALVRRVEEWKAAHRPAVRA
jgi:DNA repair protein RecN (Recombination protein N)